MIFTRDRGTFQIFISLISCSLVIRGRWKEKRVYLWIDIDIRTQTIYFLNLRHYFLLRLKRDWKIAQLFTSFFLLEKEYCLRKLITWAKIPTFCVENFALHLVLLMFINILEKTWSDTGHLYCLRDRFSATCNRSSGTSNETHPS